MEKDQSRSKDRWDKANIVISLIVTAGIGISSLLFSTSIKQTETRAQMVALAVGILKEKPPEKDPQAMALREWAIEVIDEYSGVDVEENAREILRNSALPLPGNGQLDVSALPDDAILSIDGIVQPKGDGTVTVSPGKHQVRIERNGVIREFEVEIKSATGVLTRDLLRM